MTVEVWLPHPAGVEGLSRVVGAENVRVWPGTGKPPAESGKPILWVPPFAPVDVAAVLDACPSIVGIQLMTAGADALTPAVLKRVRVWSAQGVHDAAVAEWVMAAVLASVRRFPALTAEREPTEASPVVAARLEGATAVLLGYGGIARAVEARLAPFGASTVPVARTARDGVRPSSDLALLCASADVLIVLAPLTAETRGMVSAEVLAALPDGALVVNAARGGLIDQDALARELRRGRLYAALDVASPDPLPLDHPLRELPNLLYTPHVAGRTVDTMERVFSFVAEQVGSWVEGKPLRNDVSLPASAR